MSDPTHLLIPYAASSNPAARDALQQLSLPRLTELLHRLQPGPLEVVEEDAPELPHERALARALQLDAGPGRTPWAAHQLRQSGGAPGHEAWAWITPCHWQIGMDNAVMHDPARLQLHDDHAHSLLAAMTPFFAEDGLALQFDTAGRWLARGDIFRDLPTASLDRVSGQALGPWMQQIPRARPLQRLQSEMQMLLYHHPVNDARAAQGLAPVNSFWVSGAGALPTDAPPVEAPPTVEPTLRDAALRQDWAAWTQAWQQVDATHCAALLALLARGTPVRLTLCGEQAAQTFEGMPQGFWQRVSRIFGTTPAWNKLSSL
jgi:hypothetical protein